METRPTDVLTLANGLLDLNTGLTLVKLSRHDGENRELEFSLGRARYANPDTVIARVTENGKEIEHKPAVGVYAAAEWFLQEPGK